MSKPAPAPAILARNACTQGRYAPRTCAWRECGKPYKPVKVWQRFCSPSCHNAYWQLYRFNDAVLDGWLRAKIGDDWQDQYWEYRQNGGSA